MDKQQMVQELRDEVVRLQQAISVLEDGSPKTSTRRAAVAGQPKRHGRTWTPEMRAAMSKKIKAALKAKRKKQ